MRAAILAVVLAGCGIADFDVTQNIPQQTIQGSPLPGPLAVLFPIPLNVDISQQIKQMDTGPISGVSLKSLTLTIKTAGADWSFVSEIDVYVSSTMSGTALPKVKIAHVTSPGAVQTLKFVIEPGVNLKPYVDEGSQVDGESMGNAPSQNVDYDGQGVFTVHPV
jgi:hypothetical protein